MCLIYRNWRSRPMRYSGLLEGVFFSVCVCVCVCVCVFESRFSHIYAIV
jgi:hypothetical protein